MRYIKHLIPLLCISLAMIAILQVFYLNLTDSEEQRCWQELKTTVEDVNKEITIKFDDEISKLHLIAKVMENDERVTPESIKHLNLDEVQVGTLFTRIDILFTNGKLYSGGKTVGIKEKIDFEEIKRKGEYLTSRRGDYLNSLPCVYYVLPLLKNNDVAAVLIGVIDCAGLYDLFNPVLYNGEANICIIDAEDGNYIMDNWHANLGNVYEMKQRKLLPEFADVDFKADIMSQQSGSIAFVSETTGKNIYMHYAPTGVFNWQTAVFTNEDVIFQNLAVLKRKFVFTCVGEIVLLLIYCVWNLHLIKRLQRANKEIKGKTERLEFLSYRDILTSLYNRHKYFEMLSRYIQTKPAKTGVAYIDLNDLKSINDTASHVAGDEYICLAANALTEVFGENGYRIGGDEFAVIQTGVEECSFTDSIAAFTGRANELGVSLSIGCVWRESCDDISEMLSAAEKEMYADKKEYYKQNAPKA